MNKSKTAITNEDYLIILNDLTLSNKEAAILCNKHYSAIWRWRKLNTKMKSTKKRYSDKDIMVMKDIGLSNIEVAKKLGRTIDAVQHARNKYLTEEEITSRKNGVNILVENNINKGKQYTMSEIKDIVNLDYNAMELAVMFGRSRASIYDIRRRYKHLKEVTNNE